MFDITSSRDFHGKLKADFDDFSKEPASARLALNCIISYIVFGVFNIVVLKKLLRHFAVHAGWGCINCYGSHIF